MSRAGHTCLEVIVATTIGCSDLLKRHSVNAMIGKRQKKSLQRPEENQCRLSGSAQGSSMFSLDMGKPQPRGVYESSRDAKQDVPHAKIEVLVKDFSEILTSHELADVRLICGQAKLPIIAHRAILAARCQYFLELFKQALVTLQKGSEAPAHPTWGPAFDTKEAQLPRLTHIGDTPFRGALDSGLEPISLDTGSPDDTSLPFEQPETLAKSPPLSVPRKGNPLLAVPQPSMGASASTSSRPPPPSQKAAATTSSPSISINKAESLRRGGETSASSSSSSSSALIVQHAASMKDGVLWIELPEYSYEHMAPIIEYLYSMSMPISAATVVGIYTTAFDLGLNSICPEIVNALPSILSPSSCFDVLLASFEQQPNGQPLLEAVFAWLAADASRSHALLKSPRFLELPLNLIIQMMGHHITSDDYELYERVLEARSGEIDEFLKHLSFERMTTQQLMRVHSGGKVSDRVILDAIRRKISEGLILDRVSGGSSLVLEVVVFGESSLQRHSRHGPVRIAASISPRDPSPESKERVGTPAQGSRAGVSGISPATILRRKSVANITDAERVAALGSDTWSSDSFRVHGGDWTVHLKTRGGLLYKIGMTLNHTANDSDGIQLEMWSISVVNVTKNSPPYEFNFGPTTFSMGREVFQQVDVPTSGNLGFNTNPHPFKLPPRYVIQATVQFPPLSKISFILDG